MNPRDDSAGFCALSFAQQRIWFLEQLIPGNFAYNVPEALRLRGPLDVATLRHALNAIVARHEALRTTFILKDEQPRQMVADQRTIDVPLTDLSDKSDDERMPALARVLREEAQRPFDLTRDAMLRALLVQLEPNDHVLLLTLHHIVSDGWSIGVLFRELGVLYAAQLERRPAVLPALPMQYRDCAVRQQTELTGKALQRHLAYWKTRLAGMPPTLDVPANRRRPPVLSHRGGAETLAVPRELSDRLRAFSRRERVTLFMTMLTAFQVLLQRYAGTDDVAVGTLVAGRRLETEGLIGLFVNTLVIRTDLSGNPPFREALARVRQGVLEALDHQDLPFEKLVEELRVERSGSWMPLVQVMFNFQDPTQSEPLIPSVTASRMDVDSGAARFDLAASVTAGPAGLTVKVIYSTDLFNAATIKRLLRHYDMLLGSVVADPEQPLSRLSMLTPSERHQLLVEWNRTPGQVTDQSLCGMFEAQVRTAPTAIAVTLEGRSLTYHELNRRANKLARYLERRGVGPDVLVGICLERSLETIVGLLGILKAGGAYVPLDAGDPADRLAFILKDAQVSLLVTQRELQRRLPDVALPTLYVDAEWDAISQEDSRDAPSRAGPDNLAYVIYTSGSTGAPKGVMIVHRAVSNLFTWRQTVVPLCPTDIVLQRSPLTFDASVHDIFQPLIAGAKLVLLPPGRHRDCRYIVETIRAERVSRITLVPSLMQAMVEEPDLEACTSLRCVTCGGEAWPPSLAERFRERLPVDVVNVYGPTETTVNAAAYPVPPAAHTSELEAVPIGRPVTNTQLYVLDAYMEPVPIGVPGELYIGGISLARGYLGRPELTAERFVANPFSTEPGARLYRTGDRVRYQPDGNIEYLGRLDDQVKIRGFRIELGEVEAVLRQHPDVRDCAVAAREDAPGAKRLVAYIVPRPQSAPAADSLRRFLQAKLPEYMVPSMFMVLTALPLTPSGKVDRRSLPAPDVGGAPGSSVPPQDPVQCQLARIWEELLRVHPVGITDNFFDLGGHSLLAGRLLTRVRAKFQADVSLQTFFTDPTVGGLAAAVVEEMAQTAEQHMLEDALRELETVSDEDARWMLPDA